MSEFARLIQQEEFALDEAALHLAKEVAYSDLDVGHFLFVLDESSQMVGATLKETDTTRVKLQRISQFLFEEMGIEGNIEDYYNPANSFLNEVFKLNRGIPITLSILYIALAKRLDLAVYGVGLPGHFIVGCTCEEGVVYLDPFNGGLILSEVECRQIAANYLPPGSQFSPIFLHPQSNRMILTRMLTNLRQIYLYNSDLEHLLRVLKLQDLLTPDDPELIRDLGVVYSRLEQWGKARRALQTYLHRRPQASDAEAMRTLLQQMTAHISKLN